MGKFRWKPSFALVFLLLLVNIGAYGLWQWRTLGTPNIALIFGSCEASGCYLSVNRGYRTAPNWHRVRVSRSHFYLTQFWQAFLIAHGAYMFLLIEREYREDTPHSNKTKRNWSPRRLGKRRVARPRSR